MIQYFVLALVFSFNVLAQEDVCCIFSSAEGDAVSTYARIVSSSDCKGMYQGKKVCAAVSDPSNTYCSGESTHQDRCGKCGYFWTGKECLTGDPKEKAKKELIEEQKNKEKTSSPVPTQTQPSDPDNPKVNNAIPEEDSFYNRKDRTRVPTE